LLFNGARSWIQLIVILSVVCIDYLLGRIIIPPLHISYGIRSTLLKVSLFAWRLLYNRFPTKDNLFRRAIIHHDSNFCVCWYSNIEIINNLFFTCNIFGHLWHMVCTWLGLYYVDLFGILDHFLQLGHSASIFLKRHP